MPKPKKESRIGYINRLQRECDNRFSKYVCRLIKIRSRTNEFKGEAQVYHSHRAMRIMSKRVAEAEAKPLQWTKSMFFSPISVLSRPWKWVLDPIKREKIRLQDDYGILIIGRK